MRLCLSITTLFRSFWSHLYSVHGHLDVESLMELHSSTATVEDAVYLVLARREDHQISPSGSMMCIDLDPKDVKGVAFHITG